MSENTKSLMTELAAFEEMKKAFTKFRNELDEQMKLIFTAGQVLREEMGDDAISQSYLPKLGKTCVDLKKTIESADKTIEFINDRINKINDILDSLGKGD